MLLTHVKSSASIFEGLRKSLATPPSETNQYGEFVFALRRLLKTFALGTGGKLVFTLLPGVLKALRGGKGRGIVFTIYQTTLTKCIY